MSLNGNGGRLLLACLALVSYGLIALVFSTYPPKLAGTDATSVLDTLSNLTIMAFTYFFHGVATSEPKTTEASKSAQ